MINFRGLCPYATSDGRFAGQIVMPETGTVKKDFPAFFCDKNLNFAGDLRCFPDYRALDEGKPERFLNLNR